MHPVGIGRLVTPTDDAEGSTVGYRRRGGRPWVVGQVGNGGGGGHGILRGRRVVAGSDCRSHLADHRDALLAWEQAARYHRPRWTLSSTVRLRRVAEDDGGSGAAASPNRTAPNHRR